jgi:hypothetical protein
VTIVLVSTKAVYGCYKWQSLPHTLPWGVVPHHNVRTGSGQGFLSPQ